MLAINEPSRPSANLTCVGFCIARKALKNLRRLARKRHARAAPIPNPTIDPIDACIDNLRAADSRASRSDCRKLRSHPEISPAITQYADDGWLQKRTHAANAVWRASGGLWTDLCEKQLKNRQTCQAGKNAITSWPGRGCRVARGFAVATVPVLWHSLMPGDLRSDDVIRTGNTPVAHAKLRIQSTTN